MLFVYLIESLVNSLEARRIYLLLAHFVFIFGYIFISGLGGGRFVYRCE